MEFMKQHRRAIYIALALCVVAAGVTGYLLTNRETPNQQASANQPVVDVKPPVVTPVTPDLPVQDKPQEDEEPTVEAVAELLPQVVSPLDGTTVTVFSMSELLYDETMADWRTHEGLDIQAAEGDAVKTAAAGEVTSVTRDELMGTTVCITHSGGYVTRYSSLQENPPISQGQQVKAGDIVAHQQLPIREFTGSDLAVNPTATKAVKLTDKKKEPQLTLASQNFTLQFDRATGFISKYEVGGKSLLGEGGSLKPNFWRAVTDNDMGAGVQKTFAAWRTPELNLRSIAADKKTKTVTAEYDMPTVQSTLTLTYQVDENGVLNVTQSLKTTPGAKVSEMLRFGMIMNLPYNMDQAQWNGRGPVENYSDRKLSQNVGIYKSTADKLFFPYVRPQETGTMSDLRWWQETDQNGFGFRIESDKLFSASALHYDLLALDEGEEKHQRHSQSVEKSKYTNMFIDLVQEGVGGVNSWDADGRARKGHRVEYKDYTFKFRISPKTK